MDQDKLVEQLLEEVDRSLPSNIKDSIKLRSTRQEMLKKYGNKAFLMPKEMKFPVVNPTTGKIDCKLVYAAYVRANQYKYQDIAAKAKSLYNSNNCGNKIDLKVESTLADDLIRLGLEDLITMIPKENIINNNIVQEEVKCPSCGFTGLVQETNINICPVCETTLEMTNKVEIDNINQFKQLVEETLIPPAGDATNKFYCEDCHSIVNHKVKLKLEGKCPKCDKNLLVMFENTEIDLHIKRVICPKCDTSYRYKNAMEDSSCSVCESLTVITTPHVFKELKTKGKTTYVI